MKGNFHVQFLGEGVAATSPPYPTPGWATTQVYPARITRLSDQAPNDVGGQPRFPGARKGVTLPLLVISGLATGPPAGVGDGLRFLSPR